MEEHEYVRAWLAQKKSTLWGRYYSIKGSGLTRAAEWFLVEMEDYRAYRARVVAGEAIDQSAGFIGRIGPIRIITDERAGDHIYITGNTQPLDMGRSRTASFQPTPQDAGSDPGNLQGYLHPEGSAQGSDREHQGGDEGTNEGNRSVQQDDRTTNRDATVKGWGDWPISDYDDD